MSASLIIVLLALLLSAFFSGMEVALLSSNKLRIELDRKQNKRYTKIVGFFLRRTSEYISTMLMGNNITLVIYGIAMANLCEPVITEYIVQSSGGILLVETLFATLVVLVTAEFLPKILARINPNGLLKALCVPAFLCYILLYPVVKFVTALSMGLLRLFGIKLTAKHTKMLFSKADLMNLSNEVSGAGSDENEYEHDMEIFQNALDFSEVLVRECMVPRTDLAAIEENDPFDSLHQAFIRSGHSRILIYRETIDHIIGYVHSKDLFLKKDRSELLRPVDFVPETMPAQKLLASLIKQGKALAVVTDEYGGTAGLVTIEDIIEEIFGEIRDEHDNEELTERKLSDTEFEFSGRLEIKYLNKTYELGLPESGEYETLAGYITYYNESIPQPGEVLQFGRFRIHILKTSATKIDLVRFVLTEDE
ncbi:MAG: hemolysin family protein [Prevotellaceae bacterium]|jgi:CBS domain containing-hemolysin-like protein|nr:hemolysin family protein [Prevotellaceae bacterium]